MGNHHAKSQTIEQQQNRIETSENNSLKREENRFSGFFYRSFDQNARKKKPNEKKQSEKIIKRTKNKLQNDNDAKFPVLDVNRFSYVVPESKDQLKNEDIFNNITRKSITVKPDTGNRINKEQQNQLAIDALKYQRISQNQKNTKIEIVADADCVKTEENVIFPNEVQQQCAQNSTEKIENNGKSGNVKNLIRTFSLLSKENNRPFTRQNSAPIRNITEAINKVKIDDAIANKSKQDDIAKTKNCKNEVEIDSGKKEDVTKYSDISKEKQETLTTTKTEENVSNVLEKLENKIEKTIEKTKKKTLEQKKIGETKDERNFTSETIDVNNQIDEFKYNAENLVQLRNLPDVIQNKNTSMENNNSKEIIPNIEIYELLNRVNYLLDNIKNNINMQQKTTTEGKELLQNSKKPVLNSEDNENNVNNSVNLELRHNNQFEKENLDKIDGNTISKSILKQLDEACFISTENQTNSEHFLKAKVIEEYKHFKNLEQELKNSHQRISSYAGAVEILFKPEKNVKPKELNTITEIKKYAVKMRLPEICDEEQPKSLSVIPPEKKKSLKQIDEIKLEIVKLSKEVDQFSGKEKDEKYAYLVNKLKKNLLKFDNIEDYNDKNISEIKSNDIEFTQEILKKLEKKIDVSNKKSVILDFNLIEAPNEQKLDHGTKKMHSLIHDEEWNDDPITIRSLPKTKVDNGLIPLDDDMEIELDLD